MRTSSDKQGGGQLLQELEALSQALYKSQSIVPSSVPPPRREFDQVSHRRRVSEASAVSRPPKPSGASSSLDSRHSISIPPSQEKNLPRPPALELQQESYDQEQATIDLTHKKRGGIWSWKPLRALSHIGQHRLHCEFTAHIHGIDKLPASMNGLRLQIDLRHRNIGVHTMPARVASCAAEFEELLHFRCTVYASKSSKSGSGAVKYMPKSFTLSAIAADVEELDLGRHELDLTRILPSDSLPAPSQESGSSWNTSFKLSGKARGGVLWVTFSYQILENTSSSNGGNKVGSGRFGQSPGIGVGVGSRSFNSLPSSPHTGGPAIRGKPAMEFGSPTRSEPGNDSFREMEQLDLDRDEPPALSRKSREFSGGNPGNLNSNSSLSLNSNDWSSMWKPPVPAKSSRSIDVVEHRGKPLFDEIAPGTPSRLEKDELSSKTPVIQDRDEDVQAVFNIVERGMETGTLNELDQNSMIQEQEEDDDDGEQEDDDDGDAQVQEQEQEQEQEQVETEDEQDQMKEDDDEDEQEQDDEEVADEQEVYEAERLEAIDEENEGEDEGHGIQEEQLEEEESKLGRLPDHLIFLADNMKYDWKRELEEDDIYDKSLQSPGMEVSSGSPGTISYWKQQEDTSDEFPARTNEEEINSYKDLREYQHDSEDERPEVDAKDGDEEDELVADEFLDMLQGSNDPQESAAVAVRSTELLQDSQQQSSELEREYEEGDEEEEPDSPRALLLKQFEQEAMLEGGFGLDEEEEEVAAQISFGSPIVPAFNLDEDDDPPQRLLLLQQQQQQQQFSPAPEPKMIRASSEEWNSDPAPELKMIRAASEEWNSDEDKELAAIMDAAESELQKATQAMKSKARAKMLEDAEAEALLQEWGLDENVFHDEESSSPAAPEDQNTSSDTAIVLRQGLPPLAPGIGASVPTSDGGTLRSMDSSHFQPGKNEGKLVMHISKPVVVPAEMGTTAIEVLRNLAAAGTESMAAEAMAAMPLEDITGKSVQQIALEGQACYEESSKRYDAALDLVVSNGASSASSALYQPKPRKAQNGNFLQLDELAPVAMEKIEELAMQGLKIQCDMADDEAPYVLDPVQSFPQLEGSSSSRLLLEAGSSSDDVSDGLIAMSLSLDEWMRLDAGLDDDEQASDKSKAIMAAHRAAHTATDLVLSLNGEQKTSSASSSSSSFGKMGDTLTLAMLVQLRDPLRNYEPVGAPMMALVEAERVFIPPKPKLWKRVAIKGNSESEYNEEAEDEPADPQPQFKITGVHMAGLNVQEDPKDSRKKPQQLWGNQRQQQSGSRWLVANGMSKAAGSKHPLLKSSKASKGRQGESSLWSISARPAAAESSKPLTRNPDVKFGKLAAAGGGFKRR